MDFDYLAYPDWYGTEWDTLDEVAVPADTLCGPQRFSGGPSAILALSCQPVGFEYTIL